MKINIPLVVFSSLILLAGCASNSSVAKKTYTNQEYKMMTYCIGLSDTAMHVAGEKLKGTSVEEARKFYTSKPSSQINLATVDKVYSEKITSVWEYSVSFFNECANNIANVSSKRVNLASYCMQNNLIAEVAHSYKTSGVPKEKAYAYFAQFKGKAPNEIIDKVYAGNKSRAEVKLDTWNSCMSVISDNPL